MVLLTHLLIFYTESVNNGSRFPPLSVQLTAACNPYVTMSGVAGCRGWFSFGAQKKWGLSDRLRPGQLRRRRATMPACSHLVPRHSLLPQIPLPPSSRPLPTDQWQGVLQLTPDYGSWKLQPTFLL